MFERQYAHHNALTIMPYLLYPYNSDESATVMNEPIGRVDVLPTEMTLDIVRMCALSMIGDTDPNAEELTERIRAAEDMAQVANIMLEDLTVSFDRMAFVEEVVGIQHELYKLGEELLDSMGNDSECYEAAENWRWTIEEKACHILDFPQGNFDE